MFHMISGALVAALLIYGLGLLPPPTGLTSCFYLTKVVPLGVLYALNLWGNNAAYLYLVSQSIYLIVTRARTIS